VAAGSMLVVAVDVVQAPNDKQQLEPMLGKIGALPEELGEAETLLADTGLFQHGECRGLRAGGIEPLIAMGRNRIIHRCKNASRRHRRARNPTPVAAMAHRLKTPEGRTLYALRKQTPEPVFGIIKSVLGFRQFSLRRTRKSAWRVEPCDHGVEYEADVRPQPRLTKDQVRSDAAQTARRKLDRGPQQRPLGAIARPMNVRADKNAIGDHAINFSPTGC